MEAYLKKAHKVYITGGTGYIGSHLIPRLLERGHEVNALVRKGSERKLPEKCSFKVGNPLDRTSFAHDIPPADTLVHLVGVPHPGPGKGREFREIDLVSVRESSAAAKDAGISHFIYLSVAQPSRLMQKYVQVRREGERLITESGVNATLVRPWYVVGPGHRWPLLFAPVYRLMESIPATRKSAMQYGLVTLAQMVETLVHAVEFPAQGVRVVDVAGIRSGGLQPIAAPESSA